MTKSSANCWKATSGLSSKLETVITLVYESMKILELRFKNLNSLYGEWVIDFTRPEYSENGIFALTGPTGAGKSTILDAICLALYGATPRLGRISKSGNEIMSRRTGSCYAEVLFASQAGRFRCHWEQHRARKRADGALQAPEHQIAEADGGRLLAGKKSRVAGIIEEKTGLDFDRFTRSILLAQGGFDTFLKADSEEKSKILEQITGAGIFSDISRLVHERWREEKDKHKLLQEECRMIAVMSPDEAEEISRQLAAKQAGEKKLQLRLTATTRALAWRTGITSLQKEIAAREKEQTALAAVLETFKAKREKLARAIRAANLGALYATLSTIRKLQSEEEKELAQAGASLPALESDVESRTVALNLAEQRNLKAQQDVEEEAPLLRRVRTLDQGLASRLKTMVEIENEVQNENKLLTSDKNKRKLNLARKQELDSEKATIEEYQASRARDEALISELAGIRERLENLGRRQTEMSQREAAKKETEAAVSETGDRQEKCRRRQSEQAQKLADENEKFRRRQQNLEKLLDGRRLREYRAEKDTALRELALIKQVTELENLRRKLQDGQPCPLCGAREHPFAEGRPPEADETEKKISALNRLIEQAENLESQIRKQEQAVLAAREQLSRQEQELNEAGNQKQAAERRLAELNEQLARDSQELSRQRQALRRQLAGLGEPPEDDNLSDPQATIERLSRRMKAWQRQVERKSGLEKETAAINSGLSGLEAAIEARSRSIEEKLSKRARLKDEQQADRKDREKLFADKDPDGEEKHLQRALEQAAAEQKKALSLLNQANGQLTAGRNRITDLQKRLALRAAELEKLNRDFGAALSEQDFSTEEDFLGARLPESELAGLQAEAKKLDEQHSQLQTRLDDARRRLEAEEKLKLSDQPLDELENRREQEEAEREELRGVIAALSHKLEEDLKAGRLFTDKQAAIEKQAGECRRWERLHALIGSADGKKYRNFAQGLTFELMVAQANRQLARMSDRYLLIRDPQLPLELNVIDNYQAGEIRATRNLSGGESFIVSLTLALGLSQMASRRVKVDSLFLDEGFGSLDEEALEAALETLAELQQEQKLIGIISHVPALKERLGTQITVTPAGAGRSRIAGPGCRQITND